jgi:hypothetical protein
MGHVSGGSADAVRVNRYTPTGASSPSVPAARASQRPRLARPLAGGHRTAPPQATTFVHRSGLQPEHAGRQCRLLTAAARSGRMAPLAVLCADSPQISRGQWSSRPGLGARLLKHRPLGMAGVAVACPLAPMGPHRRSGACPAPRACVPHGLQTPPHGDALAPPGPPAPHTPGQGTCTARMTACTAHTPAFSCCREPQRSGGWRQSAARRC